MFDIITGAEKQLDSDDEEEIAQSKSGLGVDEPSISLKVFLNFTTSLADKFRECNLRLIQAFGIDTNNLAVRIVWDQYLKLKCFLELFSLRGEEL